MKLTSNVKVINNFPQLRARIHEGAVPRALNAAAKEGARTSALKAGERSESGRMRNIRVAPARRDGRGWNVMFFSPAPYAWFQEHGTLGSRKRKLKQAGRRRRNAEPGSGIKPLRFMTAGRRVARASLLEHLRREISRIP